MEKPPIDNIQNIRTDTHDFLWNYRKFSVNKNTITLPIQMSDLAILDIETQCEAIQCSILAKFIKEKNQNKTWTDLMLHLDQYWKLKQGVSILNAYIVMTDRAPILPTYRTFLNYWSSFRGNEIPAPKTLSEIYNEPINF